MVVSIGRHTKPGWLNQQTPQNCLFRKIQRSPRPGLKQKAGQYPVSSIPASQICAAIHQASYQLLPDQLRHSWKTKLSGPQGQSFFWEPVNNVIPETELSQDK
jgi:hypothetical protein